MNKKTCEHLNFKATVNVSRLTDRAGTRVIGYTSDTSICCAECEQPFEFIGLPCGVSATQPMVSADGLELRAPIQPMAQPRGPNLH
jgi:hypothetical protein